MKQLTFSSLLCALFLTACGGGGGSDSQTAGTSNAPAASTTPSSPVPSTTPQVIEYYGDSTIWGYRTFTGERVPVPAPEAFRQALPAQPSHTVRNEGRSSTTSCQLLAGTDDAGTGEGAHLPWDTQMSRSTATHVIINHAINDALRQNSNYRSCMLSLVQIAKRRGKQVILETPNPIAPNVGDLTPYVQTMKDIATLEQVRIIDQFQYLTTELRGRRVETFMPDGVHPSDEVYVLKGRFAAARYAELFP